MTELPCPANPLAEPPEPLPLPAWQGRSADSWHVLHTDFRQGQHLLQTWQAWLQDPQRPARLHYTAIAACPPDRRSVLDGAAALGPEAQALAASVAAELWGLLPGVHRICLQGEQLVLTLWVGDAGAQLRQQSSQADTLYLAAGPAIADFDTHSVKALARHCRRGTQVVLASAPPTLLPLLQAAGFVLQAPGAALTEDRCDPHSAAGTTAPTALYTGSYAPRWEPKQRPSWWTVARQPGSALVIGAGLAGSAVAYSLAQRGWKVQVVSAGDTPADGASGLPAGLFCPHVSPDDSVLSRLSRSGVRMTVQRLQHLCIAGRDWQLSGVLEHCTDGGTGLPAHASSQPGAHWSHPANAAQLQAALLPPDTASCWHEQAGWVRPAQLVRAQLSQPGIRWQGQQQVQRLRRSPDGMQWQALDAQNQVLAQADHAIVACGPASNSLLPPSAQLPLQAIRGQISWGMHDERHTSVLPPFPVNGNGNLVTQVPSQQGPMWVMGSTFERDVCQLPISAADQALAHQHNLAHLRSLLPQVAPHMQAWFDPMQPQCQSTWGQVRCASQDRLPVVGPVQAADGASLWVSTAMGARGLTLSVLCGELLAAQLHAEPLPLDAKLAQHLWSQRFWQ